MATPARWPDWWTWELDLENPHLAKRMFDRSFTEIDLRGMLQAATGYFEDPSPNRWCIETKHLARPWIVIVEPQYDEKRLLVITAFPIGQLMSHAYLEVIYRKAQPLAAYYYLPRRPGDRSVRTEQRGHMVIDFAADDRPIGIELTAPQSVNLADLNRILQEAHQQPASPEDLLPLA